MGPTPKNIICPHLSNECKKLLQDPTYHRMSAHRKTKPCKRCPTDKSPSHYQYHTYVHQVSYISVVQLGRAWRKNKNDEQLFHHVCAVPANPSKDSVGCHFKGYCINALSISGLNSVLCICFLQLSTPRICLHIAHQSAPWKNRSSLPAPSCRLQGRAFRKYSHHERVIISCLERILANDATSASLTTTDLKPDFDLLGSAKTPPSAIWSSSTSHAKMCLETGRSTRWTKSCQHKPSCINEKYVSPPLPLSLSLLLQVSNTNYTWPLGYLYPRRWGVSSQFYCNVQTSWLCAVRNSSSLQTCTETREGWKASFLWDPYQNFD